MSFEPDKVERWNDDGRDGTCLMVVQAADYDSLLELYRNLKQSVDDALCTCGHPRNSHVQGHMCMVNVLNWSEGSATGCLCHQFQIPVAAQHPQPPANPPV